MVPEGWIKQKKKVKEAEATCIAMVSTAEGE